ncbi:hypothetical protein Tco_0518786, partial [Tanacetum coccineum]
MGVLHRSSRSVAIQDTLSSPKSKPETSKSKLKGVQSLTPAEKEVADIKAVKIAIPPGIVFVFARSRS